MANNHILDAIMEPASSAIQPELLVSAVLHLMSHYTAHKESSACVKLASVIERHLKALAVQPDLGPVLRATCLHLSEQWQDIVERSVPEPKQSGLLSRFMAGHAALPG